GLVAIVPQASVDPRTDDTVPETAKRHLDNLPSDELMPPLALHLHELLGRHEALGLFRHRGHTTGLPDRVTPMRSSRRLRRPPPSPRAARPSGSAPWRGILVPS